MNIDSVNNPNHHFYNDVNLSFNGTMRLIRDPLMKLKPHMWPFILNHRKAIRNVRKLGREQIEKRLEMIKNDEQLPNDILTTILFTHSMKTFLESQ